MMPATVVTLTTFLLEICSSSPVYNMQPAHITANIGTMGRNIRNLPCISRKTNQSGVCMFAIDCLKANGTHLGTCIDRFYFGSCCRIEPLNEVIDNSIESIIPSRVPPYRITTIKPITTTTVKTTEIPPKIETTAKRKPTTQSTTVSTTTEKIEAVTKNEARIPTTSSTTTTKETSISVSITEYPQKLSTFQSVNGSPANDITVSTTKPKTTTRTTKPSHQKPITTKPTPSPSLKPTQQKTKPTPKPTLKPLSQNGTKPTVGKPTIKPVSKPTYKPKPSRPASSTVKPQKITKPSSAKPPGVKPSKNTTKPIRVTTRKPTTTTRVPTLPENSTIKVTRKPITTTKLPVKVTTVSPITNSTFSPITTTPKEKITTTTGPIVTLSNVSNTVNITTADSPILKVNVTNVPVNTSDGFENNEIESEKGNVTEPVDSTTKGTLITWAAIDNKNNTSTSTTSINGTSEESDEWVPVTTPDGWVLLPSLPASSSTPRINMTLTTSTEGPSTTMTTSYTVTMNFTSTASPFNVSTELATFSTTLANVTTEQANVSAEVMTSTTAVSSHHDRPVNMSDFTDVCGRRMYPEARIVGGEKSSFGKWPWQISLRQWRTSTYLHKCGAALLNENWAITAAHCVDNVPPSDLLLRLGEHDLSTEAEPYLHQERRVQIVASHPQFDPRTFEYDLALLRFYEPVTFQPNIIPVCVPQTDENFVGRTAYVTGWGRLYEDGPLPSILQEVSVPVINNTVCESMYRSAGYIEHIPHIFICAGWRRGGFDSCEGDSGGPMVIQRADKRFLLAGIISWGIGCAEPNQPGVYTRISEFRDWINQILQF